MPTTKLHGLPNERAEAGPSTKHTRMKVIPIRSLTLISHSCQLSDGPYEYQSHRNARTTRPAIQKPSRVWGADWLKQSH